MRLRIGVVKSVGSAMSTRVALRSEKRLLVEVGTSHSKNVNQTASWSKLTDFTLFSAITLNSSA